MIFRNLKVTFHACLMINIDAIGILFECVVFFEEKEKVLLHFLK